MLQPKMDILLLVYRKYYNKVIIGLETSVEINKNLYLWLPILSSTYKLDNMKEHKRKQINNYIVKTLLYIVNK